MATQLVLNWTPAGGSNSLSQDVLYKRDVDPNFITAVSGLGPDVNTYTIVAALENNRIYDARVINVCSGGGDYPSAILRAINFVCPALSQSASTISTLDVAFAHTPSSITQYIVKLYDSSGTNLIDTKVINDPTALALAQTFTTQFTGLALNTAYKVRVEMYADTFTKLDCALLSVSTSNTPVCSAPVIQSAVVS